MGSSLGAEEMYHALSSSSNYGEQRPATSLGYNVGPYQNSSSPACAASRTLQVADASTQSGSATLVSQQQQQQQQQQHRTAAAHTTNYSTLDQSYLSRSPSSHILFMDCNTGHPFA